VARTFNGTTDKITTGLGAAGGLTGACTVVVIIKSNSDTQATGVIHLGASTSGSARIGIGLSATKQYWRIAGSTPAATTIGQTVADGWGLQAWCRAAGAAQTVRQHSYIFGTGVWAHADHATTAGNAAAPITSCTIGAEVTASFWNGDIAAVIVFDRKLTDQEIESLAWSLTTWQSLAPKILWMLDQSAVAQLVDDMSGLGAAQSAISGTSVSTSSLPVFNYSDGIWVPTIVKAAGGTTYTKTGAVIGGGLSSGADLATMTETGSLLGGSSSTGADASTFGETGAVTTLGRTSAADAVTASETASLTAGGATSAADAVTYAETAALLAAALASGADAVTLSETGALLAGALLSGADASARAETAALIAGALLSGVGVMNAGNNKTGSLTAGGRVTGADAAVFAELASLIAAALISGADARTAVEAASIAAGTLLTGTDSLVAVESGTVAALARITGFKIAGPATPPTTLHYDGPTPSAGRYHDQPRAAVFSRPSPTQVIA
jgi:hypothetical protein